MPRLSPSLPSHATAEAAPISPRVALIGPVPPEMGGRTHGGVATHQRYLAEGLARSGQAQVALLATNTQASSPSGWRWQPPTTEYDFCRMYRPGGPVEWSHPDWLRAVGPDRTVRYIRKMLAGQFDRSRREVLTNLLWYARFLDRARPDLIHVQHPLERHLYVRLVRTYEPGLARIPVVVTAHSLFGEHVDATIQQLMAPNLRSADRVIAVSPHVADQAIELGVKSDRVRVIRSGIDTSRFQPRDRAAARRDLRVDEAAKIVLFVGNLEPRKQVDVLIRALAGVPGAELVIVGSGESAGVDDQSRYLQDLVGRLALDNDVRFVGRVPAEELERWYAAADVFALPSSSEAQGIVALEAMASGLPVVASSVGGLLGTIDDGQTGYLVPSGDSDALAARLRQLLEDAALRARIGSAARQAVERTFTWDRTISATLDVYAELVACRPA